MRTLVSILICVLPLVGCRTIPVPVRPDALSNGVEAEVVFGDSRFCHPSSAWKACYSPDGRFIVSSGAGVVALWGADTGNRLWTIATDTPFARALSFSKDGKRVLIGTDSGLVQVVDTATGKTHKEVGRLPYWVLEAVFSPSGNEVLAVDLKGNYKFWDLETGKEIPWAQHVDFSRLECATFSNDGRLLLLGGLGHKPEIGELLSGKRKGAYGSAVVLDAHTGKQLQDVIAGEEDTVETVDFSPDDKFVAFGYWKGSVELRRTENLEVLWRNNEITEWIARVSFIDKGKRLLAQGYHKVLLIDVENGNWKTVYEQTAPNSGIEWISVSPDERRLLVVSRFRSYLVQLDLADMRCIRPAPYHTGEPQVLAFSPDSQIIASCGDGAGPCIFWSVNGKRMLTNIPSGNGSAGFGDVRFSPSGKYVATSSCAAKKTLSVRTWPDLSMVSGWEAVELSGTFCFSPDEKFVAVGRGEEKIEVLTFPDGVVNRSIPDTAYTRDELSFSPDGRFLAASWGGHAVRIWDWGKTQLVRSIKDESKHYKIWFSPDKETLFGKPDRGSIRIWRLSNLPVSEVVDDPKDAQPCHFGGVSSEGTLYAVVSTQKEIIVRSTKENVREIRIPLGNTCPISVLLSPNGQYVAVGTGDSVIKVFRVPAQRQTATTSSTPRTVSRPGGTR